MNAIPQPDLLDGVPWSGRAVLALLARLQAGRLLLRTPDGARRDFIGDRDGPHAELDIRQWDALGRIAWGSDVGLFEAWRDGLASTPDVTALLRLAIRNERELGGAFDGHPLARLAGRAMHALRANTRAGARRNIHAHYDLGNEFYGLWLDPTMSYSSGLFAGEAGLSLAEAQAAKNDRLLELLDVRAGEHVLEVGCGWGGFAERAVRTRDCRITGITLSAAQLGFARARMDEAGMSSRVALELSDYRDVGGTYDAIASVEMLEAVGERYWPTYFRALHDRLRPGGRAALQAIVIDEAAFPRYRRASDFVREYVFPGGMLPTVSRVAREAHAAGFEVEAPFLFGADYAETLRRWRAAFDAAEPQVRALGFDDRFLATWRFYLHYCEAGFDEGRIDVMQVLLRRRP